MNKIALITGAGSGIGRACAIALLQNKYSVVLTGRRLEPLQQTAELAGEWGRSTPIYPADALLYMANLPLSANVQSMTAMATEMPFIGRG